VARITENPAGFVLVLEHDDIGVVDDTVAKGGSVGAAVAAMFKVPAPIIAVVGAYVGAELWLIHRLDLGNGVYLTLPWVAIYIGNPFLIIPTSRPTSIGPGRNWVAALGGQFMTEDRADLVAFRVDRGVSSPQVVDFAIEATNPGMWRKVLVMPDGQGSQWDITIDPSQGTSAASNGLWAGQVKNGQSLSFWKAKGFGVNAWVLDLGHLENLPPGSKVTFTWLQD
jgi:hypothetical protein